MKKNVIFGFIFFVLALMTAKAQVTETELIGNRFEILYDDGGLDGYTTTAKIVFKKNGVADIILNSNGYLTNANTCNICNYSGQAFWSLRSNNTLIVQPIGVTFIQAILKNDFATSLTIRNEPTKEEMFKFSNTQNKLQGWILISDIEKNNQEFFLKILIPESKTNKSPEISNFKIDENDITYKTKTLKMKKF